MGLVDSWTRIAKSTTQRTSLGDARHSLTLKLQDLYREQ